MGNYVIIGGSSGIGKALSEMLSQEHNVTVISRTAEESNLSSPIRCHNADILEDDISAFLPEEIDGLVYCPGTINLKPFRSLKDEDFLHDYQVNVLGAVRSIRAALRPLKKSSNASVVLFSTVAVAQGMNFHSSISAAKGAIEGLTKSLAAELAPSVRINAIAPSLIDTPLAGKLLGNDKMKQASIDRHPLKRYGEAKDVAQLAAFLLSDAAKFVTGQIYGIDGGLSSVR